MPFTPFHMGFALVAKAAVSRYFSIPVFAFTQVIIDAEVLVGLALVGDLSNHAVLSFKPALASGITSPAHGRAASYTWLPACPCRPRSCRHCSEASAMFSSTPPPTPTWRHSLH